MQVWRSDTGRAWVYTRLLRSLDTCGCASLHGIPTHVSTYFDTSFCHFDVSFHSLIPMPVRMSKCMHTYIASHLYTCLQTCLYACPHTHLYTYTQFSLFRCFYTCQFRHISMRSIGNSWSPYNACLYVIMCHSLIAIG